MSSTDIVKPAGAGGLDVADVGSYIALAEDLGDVSEIIKDNLGGQPITEFDLTRLSVPSGKAQTYRWEVPTLGGSQAVEEVNGILIMQKGTRSFWPQSIDEGGGGNPPSCSSPDAVYGFGKQWATADDPDPEGEPKRMLCEECPNSQFGSDATGRGQACKQMTQLFLLREGSYLPTVITAAPTSLASVRKYLVNLAEAGLRFYQVLTAFGLEKKQNAGGVDYAMIRPRAVGALDDAALARVQAYRELLAPQLQRVTPAGAGD